MCQYVLVAICKSKKLAKLTVPQNITTTCRDYKCPKAGGVQLSVYICMSFISKSCSGLHDSVDKTAAYACKYRLHFWTIAKAKGLCFAVIPYTLPDLVCKSPVTVTSRVNQHGRWHHAAKAFLMSASMELGVVTDPYLHAPLVSVFSHSG